MWKAALIFIYFPVIQPNDLEQAGHRHKLLVFTPYSSLMPDFV